MPHYMQGAGAGTGERTGELKSIIGAWPRVTFGLKYYNYKRTPAGKARRKVSRSRSCGVEHWHRIASLAWLTTTLKKPLDSCNCIVKMRDLAGFLCNIFNNNLFKRLIISSGFMK